MKLLLRKDIPSLGLVGDIVEVSDGYARNHLLPQRLGVEPTKANLRAIEEDKKHAEAERAARRVALEAAAMKLHQVEVTISAAANAEGHLYGSVGPREIAAALRNEGHEVEAGQVRMVTPLRKLDTAIVKVEFTPEITAEVKVWVVREREFHDDAEPAKETGPEQADKEVGDGRSDSPGDAR
jgi:large subunit ribosomal protein L9